MRPLHPIRQAREAKHLQVAELAAMVGVSVVTIWRWERGLVQPTRAHTLALARILDTPAVVLVPMLAELLMSLEAPRAGEEDRDMVYTLRLKGYALELVATDGRTYAVSRSGPGRPKDADDAFLRHQGLKPLREVLPSARVNLHHLLSDVDQVYIDAEGRDDASL